MTLPSEPAPTEISPETIEQFVAVVFGYLEGFVAIRALAETGTPERKPQSEFHRPEDAAAAIARLAPRAADESRGVFVVPGTVAKAGSARAADIVQTGVILVDLDCGDIGAARDHLTRHIGEPSLVVASGGRTDGGQDKLHLYWRLDEAGTGADLERVRALRETIARKAGGDISFRSLHQPIRVPGTIHAKNGRPAAVRLLHASAREYDLTDFEEAAAAMPALASHAGRFAPPARPRPKDLATRVVRHGGRDGVTRFEALSTMIGHQLRQVRIRRLTEGEAWAAVRKYNATLISPPWDEERLRREFEALKKRDAGSHGLPSAKNTSDGSDPAPATPFSEDALAAAFVDRHGETWRHVAAWGAWIHWTGTHWAEDSTGLALELARQVCRHASRQCENERDARRIASHRTIAAILRIAANDPRIATATSDWDRHPMILNTPAGIVDLETGEHRLHDPGLLITQITAASPGTAPHRWPAFLEEITGGDAELQLYLQRLAGYCLTGKTSEQVFAVLHGAGANGKSVFLQTISAVLGDYAATATQETFMASRTDRHLTELAGLRAARMVTVGETEAGRAWAESRIKQITGGEKVRANFMHKNHFEFVPRFKLLVAGNHLPGLTGVGEAMRRRLHLVPFTVTIPAERRDPDLQSKLLEEASGILSWALEGCAEWRRIGLSPPERVTSASQSYFADEDLVAQWIDESCAIGSTCQSTARDLFESWSRWAKDAGIDPGSQKTLGSALRSRGFTTAKVRRARGWVGIAPKPPAARAESAE